MYVLSLQRVAVSVVVEEERTWRKRRRTRRRRRRRNDEDRGDENDHTPDDVGGATNDGGGGRCHADDLIRMRQRWNPVRGGIRLPHAFPLLVGLIARALFVRRMISLSGPPLGGQRDDLVVSSCAGVALPKTVFFGMMDSLCIE
ncbi:hypothetical protein ACHAXA_007258 [Cyclostephanos tholiformis]|uniref:Uncharacterized protein n=1 Tax=Cyclostephanos tholiformis TaxID=382380 RepID=A0ABD3SHB7_9STRA